MINPSLAPLPASFRIALPGRRGFFPWLLSAERGIQIGERRRDRIPPNGP